MIPRVSSPATPLSLRQNFSWTLLGNVFYAACSWGMLVLLAKLGSPEMVGQFALGLAITAPIIMLMNLQLRAVQATDAKRDYQFGHYYALRLLMMALALTLIALIVFIAYPAESALIIVVMGIGKSADALSDIIYGLLQQQEQMDRISISLMGKGLLSLVALGAALVLTGSVLWATVGWSLASILVLLGYDLPHARRMLVQITPDLPFHPLFDRVLLWRLIRLALPLGLVMMLLSLNANLPRYFIESLWGERELGFYAAVAYLMLVGNTVVSALGQSASPRMATFFAQGQRPAFLRLLVILLGIGLALGLAGVLITMLAGPWLLTLLYQPEYASQANVLSLLMLAAGIGYLASFLGYGMTSARYFGAQLPLFLLVTGLSVLLCWALIPTMGLIGAAWAQIGTSLIQLLGSAGILAFALKKAAEPETHA